jgi:hypothetical protein
VTRAGVDIREYPLKDAVDPGIAYSMAFGEIEACVGAGLSPWLWETNQYSQSFKARILAWYGLHTLVKSHGEDAVNKKARKKSRNG